MTFSISFHSTYPCYITNSMEDNNNIDPSIPETFDPKVNYLELEPENELNFIESKQGCLCFSLSILCR
jgi:hypothetical protein